MSDARKDQSSTSASQRDQQQEQQPVKDLDVRKADMDKVKGGLRRTSDPCEGGE
ncbi:MAG TPA: hypothetical protein VKA84_18340 [Gemmatimonadaceae bacterium]|nr:hypothetical protein [Gemmatimonadaceae bacterium]